MGDHDYPATCVSSFEHGNDVRNVLLHYFGCLREQEREEYLQSLPRYKQERIENERIRIKEQRALFENEEETKDLVNAFKRSLNNYFRQSRAHHESSGNHTRLSKENAYGMNGYALFFRNSEPYSDPSCFDQFPNQKLAVKDLVFNEDPKTNPLMRECADNEIRYFHLPGNNMEWVEVYLTNQCNSMPEILIGFAGSYCTALQRKAS
jgi:hypothetical protein